MGCTAVVARADSEIMVHEANLAERGEVVATLHANHTWRGSKMKDEGAWSGHRLMAKCRTAGRGAPRRSCSASSTSGGPAGGYGLNVEYDIKAGALSF